MDYPRKSSISNENHHSYKFVKTQASFDFFRMSYCNCPTTTAAAGVGGAVTHGDGGGLGDFISSISDDTQKFFESHRVNDGCVTKTEVDGLRLT